MATVPLTPNSLPTFPPLRSPTIIKHASQNAPPTSPILLRKRNMPILRVPSLPLRQHPRIRFEMQSPMIRVVRRNALPAHQRNEALLLSIDGLLNIPAGDAHESRHRGDYGAPFCVGGVPDGRGGDEIDCCSGYGGAEAEGLGCVGGMVGVEEGVADGQRWR
jgi:hypothetical protein